MDKFEAAKVSIDMALGRGGDQVVIKNKNGFEYFGGKSKGVEKRTKEMCIRDRHNSIRLLVVIAWPPQISFSFP